MLTSGPLWLLLLGLPTACDGTPSPLQDRRTYQTALGLLGDSPREGFYRCRTIGDNALRADCGLAAVEAMARGDDEPVTALLQRCEDLGDGLARDECAFQVAEIRGDPTACARAGRFADDCRLHLLSLAFRDWVPADARADDLDLQRRLSEKAQGVGLSPNDERAWSAWFRWVLGSRPPLDRQVCEAIPDPVRRVACRETGRALYQDRLNRARDRGTYPCDGGPLPPELATTADPELDALRRRRETEDLCPGPAPG